MFTESVRIGCDFWLCLILTMTLPTWKPSCLSTSCHSNFETCAVLSPSYQETLAGLWYSSTPQPHFVTSCRTTLTVIERKPACRKQPRTDLICYPSRQEVSKPLVTESVSSQQGKPGHSRTRCKRKRRRHLQQQTIWAVYRTQSVSFHWLTACWLCDLCPIGWSCI